jgi:hypothetical protein
MKVLDPGHSYLLDSLDGGGPEELTFVKRVGEKYPGNTTAYSGTTIQEVARVCIDRLKYVDNQIPDDRNYYAMTLLREVIYSLEERAYDRHGIEFDLKWGGCIEDVPVNSHGHLWKEDMHDDGGTD